ncbi:FxSxx-COOH system tetratricopeptide repeat protein [Streptomyces hygroscopicus]|uniref:FxSxx-COOH system tetratricopeptide repeat protein n=1 Tax=Streptomyces hygroscopicus TaxID=1912 RepID=UPI0022406D22|nr:FxSxx-COOH system tetratricopeptide repeat protein [Streptomyces hygroscopicus]
MIPPRAQCFQDRAEVARLRTALAGGGTAVIGQVLAGMGGVGKTQLAADYARHAQESGAVDVLVWITADSAAAVAAGYAQAGIEVLGADPADLEGAARAFLAWLEPKAGANPCRWLVVLDDVADPADLRGLWPPASPHGRTLVTTRRRDAALTGTSRRSIEVGLFTSAEALAYLTVALASHGRAESDDQLNSLADGLGHLPLALSQAAAHLADSGQEITAYRALLADRATKLAHAAPDTLPDDQNHTVAAAWSLSIDRADTLHPVGLARHLLHLTAMLDPNGIPIAVLTSRPVLACLAEHRTPGKRRGSAEQASAVRAEEVASALRALHRLHLIEHIPDAPRQAVRIHQLVQRAVRDTLTLDQHDQYAWTAADALIAAWPAIERDTALAQVLRANASTLIACAEDALYRPHAHPILYRVGQSLGETGQAAAARDYCRHLATTTLSRLGPDHPDTLTARYDLARWRGESGDASGAAAALADLLTDRLRVFGPDHLGTFLARQGLGYWRGQAGDVDGAAAVFADLLTDWLRVFGPDHLETLVARANLAYWRGQAGDVSGAAATLADLLPDFVRVLGPDHPDTLIARANLAYWRGESGDASGAAAAFGDLLIDRLRVFGPDHPRTLSTRQGLAYWRGQAGDASGAAAAFAALLPDSVRVLGTDHPQTLVARSNLAYWRGQAGEASAADQ